MTKKSVAVLEDVIIIEVEVVLKEIEIGMKYKDNILT